MNRDIFSRNPHHIMPNVLHIVRKPVIGGAEMLVKNIINANHQDDNYMHFLLYTSSGPLIELFPKNKLNKLIRVNAKSKIDLILKLRKTLKNYKIYIIHTHQPIDAIFAIFATFGLNIKVIRSYHGFEGIYDKSNKLSLKSKFIYFLINRFVTLNIFVSEALLKYYQKRNPKQLADKQVVLHNGIDNKELLESKPVQIKNQLGLPKDSKVLGMIGGFTTKVRDQYTICRAMNSLLHNKEDVHFIFIGKTNNSKSYKKCYQYCIENNIIEHVHFLGERNDIGGLIKAMDIYVHSSNNDTFGLALVEAMLCNVPCIASDIPALREVSNNGKLVTHFEKGNDKELSLEIENVLNHLNNDEFIVDKTKKAKNFAENNFTIESHISKLLELYNQCLKS